MHKKLFSKSSFFILLLLFLLILFLYYFSSSFHNSKTSYQKTGFFFDTVITITLYEPQDKSEALLNDCFSLCEKYENLFSTTVVNSDIYKLNHSNGSPVTVDSSTARLISYAIQYAALSEGIIDPTIAPLSSLWNFSSQTNSENPIIPDEKSIKELLPHVDYKTIHIEDNIVSLTDPAAQIDLGFIAKGFIADELKQYLLEKDIHSATINLGGNVLTIGSKPDHSAYRIGIQKPFDARNSILFSLPVTDSSVVTSGCYERYFYVDSKLYHHILNPQTGYPVQNNLLSVTILSKESVTGDAYSTWCFALGLNDGMKLIENTPDIEAIFVTKDYKIHSTSGVKNLSF